MNHYDYLPFKTVTEKSQWNSDEDVDFYPSMASILRAVRNAFGFKQHNGKPDYQCLIYQGSGNKWLLILIASQNF